MNKPTIILGAALILGTFGSAQATGLGMREFAPSDLTQPEPPKPPPPAIPLGKCSTDVALFDALKDNGYKILLQFKDISKPESTHILFFSSVDNRFVLGHSVASSTDAEKIEKVCVEYIGNDPEFEGSTFRELVLAQHMLENQAIIDENDNAKKETQKKHDQHVYDHGSDNKS